MNRHRRIPIVLRVLLLSTLLTTAGSAAAQSPGAVTSGLEFLADLDVDFGAERNPTRRAEPPADPVWVGSHDLGLRLRRWRERNDAFDSFELGGRIFASQYDALKRFEPRGHQWRLAYDRDFLVAVDEREPTPFHDRPGLRRVTLGVEAESLSLGFGDPAFGNGERDHADEFRFGAVGRLVWRDAGPCELDSTFVYARHATLDDFDPDRTPQIDRSGTSTTLGVTHSMIARRGPPGKPTCGRQGAFYRWAPDTRQSLRIGAELSSTDTDGPEYDHDRVQLFVTDRRPLCRRDAFGNPRCPWAVESSVEYGRYDYDNPSSYAPFASRNDTLTAAGITFEWYSNHCCLEWWFDDLRVLIKLRGYEMASNIPRFDHDNLALTVGVRFTIGMGKGLGVLIPETSGGKTSREGGGSEPTRPEVVRELGPRD